MRSITVRKTSGAAMASTIALAVNVPSAVLSLASLAASKPSEREARHADGVQRGEGHV